MASGFDDSANVLYYSNVNYNSGTAPKSSYVMTTLGSRFLNNQSNYEVGINKLKVSSLEGVRMGYVPYNQWEIGLSLPNGSGGSTTQTEYVNLAGMVPATSYYEYYTNLDRNYNINLYRGVDGKLGNLELSFIPKDVSNNQITPFFSVYDPINEIFWVCTYYGIFVYNATGEYITSQMIADLRSANYSVAASHLIVVQNNTSTQNVFSFKWQNAITPVGTFADTIAGTPLTDIRCAATDGQTMIIVWNNTSLMAFYASTYNYQTYAGENEGELNAEITNPVGIIVNTVDDSFIVMNNSYDELKQLSANTTTPFTSGTTYGTMVNIGTGVNMFDPAGVVNTIDNILSFQSFDNHQTVFSASKDSFGNYWSGFQSSLLWDNITQTNWNPSPVGGSNFPFTIAYYNTPDNMPLLIGIRETQIVGSFDLVSIGANGAWAPFYFISGIDTTAQIMADINGVIWMVYGGQLKKLSVVPTYTAGSAPYLHLDGGIFNNVSIIGSSHQISSFVWDNLLLDVGYCLVGENTTLYKALYNSESNTITLLQWHTDANTYTGYLSKCFAYASQTNNTDIYKYNITSFVAVGSPNNIAISNNYAPNIQISRGLDIVYVPNTVGQAVSTYDYLTFVSKGTISGFLPYGGIGVYTSLETTPPTLTSSAYYNLQTIVDAVNAAYETAFETLKTTVNPMPVSGAPSFVLDYSTHRLTMTYDPKWAAANSAISINDELLRYFHFTSVKPSGSTLNNFVLSPSGSMIQSKETIYQLNTVDKLIIKTNMSLLTDFTGSDTNTTIFTDLDFDTQNQFFNLSGDFLYDPQLLRNYAMISNQQLRSISYQLFIAYLDGTETELLIPTGQNASIKFQFTRIY